MEDENSSISVWESIEQSLERFNLKEMNDNSIREFESNTKTLQKSLTNRHLSLKISGEREDKSLTPRKGAFPQNYKPSTQMMK